MLQSIKHVRSIVVMRNVNVFLFSGQFRGVRDSRLRETNEISNQVVKTRPRLWQ